MDIPKQLYRYMPLTMQSLASLSAGKIWFSHPGHFNDPFDCAYDITISQLSRKDCIELIQAASDGQINETTLAKVSDATLQQQVGAGLKSAIKSGLDVVGGVSCFSEINDDLLMWGHYSNGHRGFCLEFDTAKDEMFKKAKQVEYADAFPCVGVEDLKQSDFPHILKLLLTKATCWQYEKEWRVLHQKSEFLYGYERSSLTGIYFGAKMPEDQMHLIASVLEMTDTMMYRMQIGMNRFALVPETVTFTRYDYRTSAP